MRPLQRILFWLDPGQESLARAIAERAKVEIAGAGSPQRGKSAEVAAVLGVPAADDLRSALIAGDCQAVVILAPMELGCDAEGADVRALMQARARGVRCVCLEASPRSAMDLLACGWDALEEPLEPDDVLVAASLAWQRPPELVELMAEFGVARSVQCGCGGPAVRGTLAARLVFAHAMVSEFLPAAESVDACFSDAVGNAALHMLPQEKVTELHGTMNCLLRCGGGRSATLLASDQYERSWFDVRVLGTNGSLHLSRTQERLRLTFEKPGAESETFTQECGGRPHEMDFVHAALQPVVETTVSIEAMLIFAQTALLSARTGEAESTETLAGILASARG